MENINKLTFAESERLAILMEECGEVIQIIGKILRHGYSSSDPNIIKPYQITNRDLLTHEVADILAITELMTTTSDLDKSRLISARDGKLSRITGYTHYQEPYNAQ